MRLRKALKYISLSKRRVTKRSKSSKSVLWENASDIGSRVKKLIKFSKLEFNPESISTLRSYNSKSRAYARIWGLSKVWQMSLKLKPHYVIEVLSEKFDGLPDEKKDEVLLHELAHIPNNFSGSLLPHIRRGKRCFGRKVDSLIKEVRLNKKLDI